MSNQQTLRRAATVEQLLEQNGVPVDDLQVDTATDRLTLSVDTDRVDLDPTDDATPIDPARGGGGTIKASEE